LHLSTYRYCAKVFLNTSFHKAIIVKKVSLQ
jgi:hypothetical protein